MQVYNEAFEVERKSRPDHQEPRVIVVKATPPLNAMLALTQRRQFSKVLSDLFLLGMGITAPPLLLRTP